ncbi:MAG TPA: hypothetical protein VED46_15860 [Alphaproteobacteria bacterium]|nr:hypothetical protein [Alphaproteobacteria bacterium]
MSTILPDFDQAKFIPGSPVDNPYFPLDPGTVLSYRGVTGEGEVESNDVLVTDATRRIEGVEAIVVRDTAYLDGLVVEDTLDWYAQDKDGNVWYLGELTFAYEYGSIETDTEGSWETGVEVQPGVVASPGFIMPSAEQRQELLDSGDSVYSELAPGTAEDEFQIISLDAEVEIEGLGTFENVVQTSERTALEPLVSDFKYYAPGIGQIRTEELADGEVELTVDLVSIRDLNVAKLDDVEQPELSDFKGDGGEMWVTLIASDGDHAVGAYEFANGGKIGEGSILFASTDGLTSGESTASIEVPKNAGLGLFLVPDAGELAEFIDLSEFEEGGLVFTNPIDFGDASLKDGLAPLVSAGALNFEAPVNLPEFEGEEEVFPLPLQIFHALDGYRDGINPLNPAGNVQAIDLNWEGEGDVEVIGFEDRRVTDPDFDGDFNDVILAISHDPLDSATIDQIAADLQIPEDTLVG